MISKTTAAMLGEAEPPKNAEKPDLGEGERGGTFPAYGLIGGSDHAVHHSPGFYKPGALTFAPGDRVTILRSGKQGTVRYAL